jgi:hypothetical protein
LTAIERRLNVAMRSPYLRFRADGGVEVPGVVITGGELADYRKKKSWSRFEAEKKARRLLRQQGVMGDGI